MLSTTDLALEMRTHSLEPTIRKVAPIRRREDPRIHQYKLLTTSYLPEFEKLKKARRAFLRGFAETLSIAESAKRIGYDPDTHYYWLRHDKLYAKSFEAVKAVAIQNLEDEAVQRAKEGILVPVVSAGKLVTYERKYSDTLMISLLQRFNPEAYKKRSTRKLTRAGVGPVDLKLQSDIDKALVEHMEVLRGAARSGAVTTAGISERIEKESGH